MKPVWKWIIGIVVGLIVMALLSGAVIMVRGNFSVHKIIAVRVPGWPSQENDQRGFRGPEDMMPGFGMRGYGMGGPGMMGYGRMEPLGGIFMGLISLGFLALLALGIVWLVRSLRTPKQAVAAVAMHDCPKCGQPVQEDWKNCPHCGKKL